jgi:hypothetical protein
MVHSKNCFIPWLMRQWAVSVQKIKNIIAFDGFRYQP